MHFKAGTLSSLKDRTARFIASDESVDRMGDIIRASGWDLRDFKKNPVLLWGHNSRDLPIGKVSKIEVVGKQLIADATFATEAQNPFAEKVYQLIKGGILKAVSVGFSPKERPIPIKDRDDRFTGYEFISQSLHELSVVNVPANANALAIAKSLHLSQRDIRKLFAPDVASDTIRRDRDRLDLVRIKAQLGAKRQ